VTGVTGPVPSNQDTRLATTFSPMATWTGAAIRRSNLFQSLVAPSLADLLSAIAALAASSPPPDRAAKRLLAYILGPETVHSQSDRICTHPRLSLGLGPRPEQASFPSVC